MNILNTGMLLSQMYTMVSGSQNTQFTAENSNLSETLIQRNGESGFAGVLRGVTDNDYTDTETYLNHLKEKYGNIRLETVGRDQKSIEKAAGTMSGNDIIVAPKALDKMARDQKLAEKIEGYIDKAIAKIPQDAAWCAARGLVFDFEGIIVHEDGTVTEICGCSDSPERVAEVNRINKEKREKEAAERERIYEYGREMAAERTRYFEECQMRAAMQTHVIGQQYEAGMVEKYIPSYISGSITA
ncbi:MAG: DUF6033 family protein [Lachnospiraceae bacterium]|nr:DUF6033 family protein [Lachnospiraceae bacterium]